MKKLLGGVLLLILAGGFWSCGGSSGGGGGGNTPVPAACKNLPAMPNTTPEYATALDNFTKARCYDVVQHWKHDAQRRTSQKLHDTLIRMWYSPPLFKWMTDQNPLGARQGPVPDGAMVVKEEFPNETGPEDFWSVMVKDSSLWWDGWYWRVVGTEVGAVTAPAATSASGCAEAVFEPNGPSSINCIGCHASADYHVPGTGTFSPLTFINMKKGASAGATSAHEGLPAFAPHAMHQQPQAESDPTAGFTDRLPSSIFANVRALSDVTIPCMPPESLDFFYSKPPATGGPSLFVTSNQCASCHDATNNFPMPTHMLFTETGATSAINVSTYGEWRYSMMGLAGRDPIFFAQLDTESTVHANIKGKPNPAGFVQDTCLSCHGAMGQRQFHIDKGNDPNTLFTRDILQDPTSQYGALGRDGISCNICHHMADQGLDDPTHYTGKFVVGPADQLYGPYPSGDSDVKVGDNVIPRPMKNSVGMVPVFGSQVAEAKICASCHVIVLPVYDANGNQLKTEFEQATYLEWLNSSFAKAQPCQDCHMPDNFKGTKVETQVANIEDSTFPRVPEVGMQTSLPNDQLVLQTRTSYARHQLLGINPFALEMFDQFRTDLGLYKDDGLLPPPTPPAVPPDVTSIVHAQKNAVDGAVSLAQTATAVVTFDSATKNAGQLTADVRIQNLAGHNFPSGVEFRRAFVDVQVLDAHGTVLWESGATNGDGVITDTAGTPLVTEFFSPSQQTFQPHFWTDNPITSDKQVQIYEAKVLDPQGQLTTSFLALNKKVKDNRIQPKGRSSTGPAADILAPEGTGADPSYQNGCGCSLVRYQLPLTGELTNAAQVRATLYYQSIPPSYLRQRAEDAHGPDTARLIKFTNELDVKKYTEISNWKLQVGSSVALDIK